MDSAQKGICEAIGSCAEFSLSMNEEANMGRWMNAKRKEGIVIVTVFEGNCTEWESAILEELYERMGQLKEDPETQAVIVIREQVNEDSAKEAESTSRTPKEYERARKSLLEAMSRFPIPSIVVIEGRAAGDFLEFSLLCDFRLAAEDAQLDFGAENGRLPSAAAIRRLSGLIGEMKVKELFFSGSILCARQAAQLGLISKVEETEHLMAEAIELAKTIWKTDPELIAHVRGALEER